MSSKPLAHSSTKAFTILTGARSSPLSRVQVREVENEIRQFLPDLKLEAIWMETLGDKDKKTSLRGLDKTDFFTREIDQMLLAEECRIGLHSAKDLPEVIPEGLSLIAVTKGIDKSDALVFREGESLSTLPKGAKIATSSERREDAVKQLREDLEFMDIRGTIEERLAQLSQGAVDGVVIAEAALIRLQLTRFPRITLPGNTVPGQGQLAIVARENDEEMRSVFSILDTRLTTLYLGINCPKDTLSEKFLHYPIIKTVPRKMDSKDTHDAFSELPKASHAVFTSQEAVIHFFNALRTLGISTSVLNGKTLVAVGKKTAESLNLRGFPPQIVAQMETAEGICLELEKHDLRGARFFWPHSSLSRPVIKDYLKRKNLPLKEIVLYDTCPQKPGPPPSSETFEQIVFTSPSTVDAFLHHFGAFPKAKTLKAIGPVTAKYLHEKTTNNDRRIF